METLLNLPVIMGASYFTIYLLIPVYFRKQRWGTFVFLSLTSLLFFVFLMRVILYFLVLPVWYPGFAARNPSFLQFNIFQYIFYIYSVVIFMALLKVARQYASTKKHKELLERQNLLSEMALLRSQVNPHFLFNTLNNIHTLVNSDPSRCAESIVRLSGIMRYMMSDASQGEVGLEEEIGYLRNYIGLLELRLDKPSSIRFTCLGDPKGKSTPPMLFIPFVENAYKHGWKEAPSPAIDIMMQIEDHRITFNVENYLRRDLALTLFANGGIGVQNVQRRLELLFPGKHSLNIRRDQTRYYVEMIIDYA